MIDSVFGPEFKRLITAGRENSYTGLDNIHRDLVELAIAGIYSLESPRRPLVWVVGVNENLKEKAIKLRQWLRAVTSPAPHVRYYTLPFEDPYINNSSDTRAVGDKINLLADIRDEKPLIVITTLPALNLKLEPKDSIPAFFRQIEVEGETDRDELIETLTAMGYCRRDIVEEGGDIAWRGSIVDVFPIDNPWPVRIEIEGDLVISIRIFDPDTQKSLKRINTVSFSIARFFLNYEDFNGYFNGGQEGMHYLTELLGDYRMVVSDKKKVLDEFNKLIHHYEKIFQMVTVPEARDARDEPGEGETTPEEIAGRIKDIKHPSGLFCFPFKDESIISIDETWDDISNAVELIKLQKSIADFNLDDVRAVREKVNAGGYRLVIFSDKKDSTHLEKDFESFDFVSSRVPHSFENPDTRTIFLSEKDFQYVEKPKKSSQLKSEQLINEIQLDDLVVHQTHGIGRFTGFKKLKFEDHVSEFLKIEYLGREYLYVPVYELDVLSKYVSFEGHTPRVDKLGGNSWASKKTRAKRSIMTFARDLLELYAMRKSVKGTVYPSDYELESQLGEGFQYVETEDQKRAIRDVFTDLEAEYPMDRLICGDVSFGKTEVALRAAMRVVANGKQVAVLCPTTILAYQHYATFKQRFGDFPISVSMLSRMVTAKRRKVVHDELAAGRMDIVIGTHSLISKDVRFKRLGLYVIDEEQRFGVFQKEKLKKGREDVDVLSLSATPIPRTLSLSMAGLQDISTIRTPPLGRLAVKNFVGYFSKEIVISGILNEVERDGQVFIVYNNIERIYTFQKDLEKWIPGISSTVLHAKMKTQDIETGLMDFIGKRYRVLLSTTIIENGLDIPGVNTLMILNAERFGLTQLYQLRGRIGRSNRQAYAYFLVKSMEITDKAKSRLDAIREFADLGSGYKLAEFDLKLRGAGSLLGNKQHGHIEALGFDYYHQLLVKTIKELQGDEKKSDEGKINIHFSYSIASDYIKNSMERIVLYRRILEAEDFDRIEELRVEMADRYGRAHPSIEKIFFAGMVRVMMRKYQLEEVDVYLDRVIINFPDNARSYVRLEAARKLPVSLKMEIFGGNSLVREFSFTDYKTFVPDFISFWE
ncbi:MAG: DEAD/DEAH box helicase [bacterium]|nr:DEAD/DEAH box helicase [bacterium]